MRLFCVLASFFFASAVFAETRAAFVVGNSDYENAPSLSNPVRDARLVGDTLVSLGFDVTRHQDLTRERFSKALGAFLKKSRDADVTFFYFAGHGMQYDGQNYLVGTDAELISELDIEGETIALNKVVELLEKNSKAALIFVDACRDNPLATDFYRRNFSETRALNTRGLARVRSRIDGSMLVFAAGPGQVAYDGDGRNSPFATALATHLPTEGKEILTLTKRIIGDVRDATDGRQSPIVTNDLTKEIFLREAALRPQSDAASLDHEQKVFDAADKLNTLHSWARYFAIYPKGRLHELALQEEHEVLLREASILSNEWTFVAAKDNYPASIVTKLEVRIGFNQDDALAAQALLARLGHYSSGFDGALGTKSRQAIQSFQKANNLPETGMLTRATAAKLGLSLGNFTNRPNFSSHHTTIFDIEAARLLGFDEALVSFIEKEKLTSLIYGYRGDRVYVVANAFSSYLYFTDFLREDRAPNNSPAAYVATIGSDEENQFIYDLVRYYGSFWRLSSNRTTYFGPRIGLFQTKSSREPRSDWYWQGGQSSTYRNWAQSEPNNHNGNEDFVQLQIPFGSEKSTPNYTKGALWNDSPYESTATVFEIELDR